MAVTPAQSRRSFHYVVEDAFIDAPTVYPREEIMRYSDFMKRYDPEAILVLGFYAHKPIAAFRAKNEVRLRHLFSFEYGWLADKPVFCTKALLNENLSMWFETYNMVEDSFSREVMIEYIHASVSGELNGLLRYNQDTVNFNGLLKGLPVKTYVDCGAHDGDTIHEFAKFYPDYQRVFAVEPDEENLAELERRIVREKLRDVHIFPAGTYYKNGELYLSNPINQRQAGVPSSKGAQDQQISVKTIDSMELNSIDLIKMDIEGSELDALRGARRSIKTHKPALAVCVYHNPEDLITIPQYIHDLDAPGIIVIICGTMERP